jgi:serpin B
MVSREASAMIDPTARASLCVFVLLALAPVCSMISASHNPAQPDDVPAHDIAAAAAGSNRFAADLLRQMAKTENQGNLFVSPASVVTALGMTAAGAKGDTANEMATVLHLDTLRPESRHASLGALAHQLVERPGVSLQIANRLWGQAGFPFRAEFLAQIQQNDGAGLESIPFSRPDEARRVINAWVSEHTDGKVPELIPSGILSAETRLVLTNAIVFKAKWATPFRVEATRPEPFHFGGDRKDAPPIDVPMMHQSARLGYLAGDGFQAVELPYEQRSMSLVVLLPAEGRAISDLESQLTGDALAGWMAGLKPRLVELSLPRFHSSSSVRLDQPLRALGMNLAFDLSRADFSGMTDADRLAISAIIHEAVVDVDEKGTEAAAATAVTMVRSSAMIRPETPVVVRADRPFLYLIRDNATGAILFLGRLADPRG